MCFSFCLWLIAKSVSFRHILRATASLTHSPHLCVGSQFFECVLRAALHCVGSHRDVQYICVNIFESLVAQESKRGFFAVFLCNMSNESNVLH